TDDEPVHAERRDGAHVVERADAARRDHGDTGGTRCDRACAVEVGALLRPVAPDVGVDERRYAERGEARGEVGRGERGRLRPARDAEPPVARIEADRDATGMRPADGGREVGGLDRDRAEHGARGAGGEHRIDRRRVAEPAAHLHRIVAVDGLAVEGALPETHAAAAAQVERRIDRHAPRTTPTKLSSSRSPTCWLFSGWNWQANTLSRTTLDANSWPYGVVVATTSASRGTG